MARPGTAARRYAEAAFELAQRDGTLDRWRDDLDLAAAVVSDERVAPIVSNRALASGRRRAMLEKALGSRVSGQGLNLVGLLVERGRIELLPRIAREYRRLLNRHNGVVEAVVTSAAPLTDEEVAAVRARIEQMSGATVDLRTEIDEGLIGGLTVRVGDRLLDASVRGRLERLREQLVAGVR